MFDIGFFELLVVVIVGLVVIGPERLPGAIRSGALWWGRIKRSMRETRSEIEKQFGADDIRRELHNEEVMRSLEALRTTREDLEKRINTADQAIRHSTSASPAEDGDVTPGNAPDLPQQPDSPPENETKHD